MSAQNIDAADFGKVAWDDRRKALGDVYQALIAKSKDAEGWYASRKSQKLGWARVLRGGAIVLGLASAICPVAISLASSFGDKDTATKLLPLASIAVILAGGCVTADTFFGFSSGWMRYVATFQDLQSRREAFELLWPRVLPRGTGDLGDAEFEAALDALATFSRAINEAVRAETQAWIGEFKAALNQLGDALEKQRAAVDKLSEPPAKGALVVRVENAGALDGGAWTLELTGRDAIGVKGASEAIEGLPAGLVAVRARGTIAGKEAHASDVASIADGERAEVALTLVG